MLNTYTEEFKRNAVSVVRAGYSVPSMARRLNVPESTIRNWASHPRYQEVEPATEELLTQIPGFQVQKSQLIRIDNRRAERSSGTLSAMRLRIGSLEIETSDNTTAESFKLLLETLRSSDVL
ncbi:MAG: transposase [Spirochaetales bacterium]|nr:transposase [Spirochaetales bacterium]